MPTVIQLVKSRYGYGWPKSRTCEGCFCFAWPPSLSLAPLGLRAELGASSGVLVSRTLQMMQTRLQQQFVARGTVHFLMRWKKNLSLSFSVCLKSVDPEASSPQASSPSSLQSATNKAIRTVQQSVSWYNPSSLSVSRKKITHWSLLQRYYPGTDNIPEKGCERQRLIKDSAAVRGRYFLWWRKYLIFLSISHVILPSCKL